MRSKNPNAGFTLPEVLTAVVIVGLVLVTLYSCWAAVLGATQSSTIAVQDAQRERMAIRAITEALAGVSWYENRKEGPLRLDDSLGFSHLKLISRVPPGFWGERELANYPLRRIEFLTEDMPGGESQLVMIQQALLAPPNSVKVHRTVLLPHVETFAVEVHPGGISNTWEAFWPTLFEANGLPWQAKVALGAVKEFPRQSTLPIFASLASHAKGPPALGIIGRVGDVTFAEGGFDVDGSDSDSRIIFVIDKSGSMYGDRLEMAKEAIMRSLMQLQENRGKFYIYFFNRQSDAMPASAMLEATPDNILRMSEWLKSQKAQGGTDPSDSIKSAFSHKPTELFLLTDGAFRTRKDEPAVRDLLNSLNSDKAVKINTLGIGESLRGREGETALMLIAKDNGGSYTFIDPSTNAPDPVVPAPPAPKK
jgi:prepilin-type N-terminal cleavage/methylation domain-containing protein